MTPTPAPAATTPSPPPTTPHWTTISASTLLEAASRYSSHLPAGLSELDTYRLNLLPAIIQQRRRGSDARRHHASTDGATAATSIPSLDGGSDAYMTKEELVKLVEWKLKHGTFRPSLRAQVASNDDAAVRAATAAAFALLSPAGDDGDSDSAGASPGDPQATLAALDALLPLRGVGPATASLILSCLDPSTTPFFNDELYRWLLCHPAPPSSFPSSSSSPASETPHPPPEDTTWLRAKIVYTRPEYTRLVTRAHELLARLGAATENDVAELEELEVRIHGPERAGALQGGTRDAKVVVVDVGSVERAAWVFAREAEARAGVGKHGGMGKAPALVQTMSEVERVGRRMQPEMPAAGVMPLLRRSARRGRGEEASDDAGERPGPQQQYAKRKRKT